MVYLLWVLINVSTCVHPYGKDANGNANGDKDRADLSFQVQPVPPEGSKSLSGVCTADKQRGHQEVDWGIFPDGPVVKTPVSKQVKVLTAQSCLTGCNPMACSPPGSSVHEIFPGEDTVVACHFLLQGIFPTQGSNPGLLHFR